jgi:hypothetical protein
MMSDSSDILSLAVRLARQQGAADGSTGLDLEMLLSQMKTFFAAGAPGTLGVLAERALMRARAAVVLCLAGPAPVAVAALAPPPPPAPDTLCCTVTFHAHLRKHPPTRQAMTRPPAWWPGRCGSSTSTQRQSSASCARCWMSWAQTRSPHTSSCHRCAT